MTVHSQGGHLGEAGEGHEPGAGMKGQEPHTKESGLCPTGSESFRFQGPL